LENKCSNFMQIKSVIFVIKNFSPQKSNQKFFPSILATFPKIGYDNYRQFVCSMKFCVDKTNFYIFLLILPKI